jgi:YD repeat-containing protein
VERLEDRRMLALASLPDQALAVGGEPVAVAVGPVDRDAWQDLVSLSADGRLTVAINGGSGSWSRVAVSDLGLAADGVHGLALGLIDDDSLLDAVIQHAAGITVARGDGTGRFAPLQTWRPDDATTLVPEAGGRVGLAVTLVDDDFHADLIAVLPGTNEVLVFLGGGGGGDSGPLRAPVRYASGAEQPVEVVVGQFLGSPLRDLAVGHRDGTVTFLEGLDDGAFQLRPAAAVGGLGEICGLAADDFDADGDLDLAVSGGDRVSVLWQDDDILPASPIRNGDFAEGLTGWTIGSQIGGLTPDPGAESRINALGGVAQLWEHESFLTSLHQTFTIPPSPQTISFDVVALGLEAALGGVPDAFEVSLLNEAGQSLVPVFRPEATSFFNANPEGAVAWAAGVVWDGRHVTLDIASLTPGTRATLVFDLIGNPPGRSSVAAVDNVRIEPDHLPSDSFTPMLVGGGFGASAGIAAGDVDGDGHADLIVADAAADRLVVFNGEGAGQFARDEWSVASYGHAPQAVALGRLTPEDAVLDVAIGLAASGRVLTPLGADELPPQVTLVRPAANQTTAAAVTQIELQFSEAMRDSGPAGEHSVTNLAAYRLYTAGANGEFEDGGGDDQLVTLGTVRYDAATRQAFLSLGISELPDGVYAFRVGGGDARYTPLDLDGHPLAGGDPVLFFFAVNAAGPVDLQAADLAGSEGQAVTLNATFRNPGSPGPHIATIDWGDGSVETAVVDFTQNPADVGGPTARCLLLSCLYASYRPPVSSTPPTGAVTASHAYADNGRYVVQVRVADESLERPPTTLQVVAVIANTPPTLTLPVETVRHTGLDVALQADTFTDPGFDNPAAGTVESFTATIDWGDGSAPSAGEVTAGTVTAWAGSADRLTAGAIQGSHQYAAAGSYQVTVTVADDDGGTDSRSFTLQVTAIQNTRFFVVDRGRRATYLYDAQFASMGVWPLARRNAGPRGVAANPAGDTLWIVNNSKDVFAYDADGTLRGSWRASDVRQPQDIATDGRHLWIVDDAQDRVFFYADAADRRSGKWTATRSFPLHPDNAKPSGLATDGNRLWITDARCGRPRVFVYTLDGQLLGSWSLDPANGHPRGITLQRSTGDLWVVDQRDVQVFRYAQAAARTSGNPRADGALPLAAGNRHPEGIADPVAQIQIGDSVSDSIAAAGEVDEFAFEITEPGQSVYVDFQSLTGGVLVATLVRTVAGTVETVYTATSLQTAGLDRGPLNLTAGTYTLQVRASDSGTRAYGFRLWDVPPPAVLQTQIGAVNQGVIPSPGASQEWRFEAAAGQSIYVDFQDAAGNAILETRLLDSAGTTVYTETDFADDRLDRGPLTLAQAGTYTFRVNGRGDQIGAYQFQLWDVPPDRVQSIPRNTPISGLTASPVDRVRYQFDAQAGEQLLIDLIDNPQQVYFDLERPSGGFVFQRQTGDQLPAALPEAGTYTLVASSYQPVGNVISDHFGAFRFQVQQVAAPALGVPDSRGTDFWLGFPRHYRDALGDKDAELVLQITSQVDTSGTVMVPGQGSWMAAFTVRAGQVTRITLPDAAEIVGSDQVESRGVRVRALQEVTVHALSYLPFASDGYLALPRDTFGLEYLVLSYGEGDAQAGRTSSFSLVAAEDGTTATITLPVDVGPRAANVPYSINLNAGQVYELAADAAVDLTGARIVADRPIGVYGGHRAAQVPAGYNAANHLVEQLPPVDTWGRHFLTVPLATRSGGDRFRVLAARDATEIRVDQVLVATLDRGQFYETVLAEPAEIAASEPVLVAQFAHGTTYDSVLGDPTLLLVPSVEQFLDRYTLATPLTGFDANYLNIVAPQAAVGAITLDGAAIPAAQFAAIGTSGFFAAQVPVAPGSHHLAPSSALRPPTSDLGSPSSDLRPPTSDLRPFAVFAYGFAERDAYGYPAGQGLGRINAVANFELAPHAASQQLGNQQMFVATLTDSTSQPLPGVRVDFAVAGTHAARESAFTDGLGRAVFTLTGSRPGGDTVTATAGTWSDTAIVTWTAPLPAVTVTAPESGSQLRAGSTVVLAGRATPGLPAAPVLAVTVNNRPVDALDAAGNFFALLQVASGVTALTVQATDAWGQTATADVTLIGVEPSAGGFAFDQAHDTTAAGRLAFEGTFFNRQTQTLHAGMRLTNTGDDLLRAAVLAVFDSISPPEVTLAASEGLTPPAGEQVPPERPYLTFDAASFDGAPALVVPPSGGDFPLVVPPLGGEFSLGASLPTPPGVLTPAETSRAIPVRFDNPRHRRFEFDVTLLAVGNTPPEFQTPPVTEAAASRPYQYAAAAADADRDTLTYRLAAGPEFLSVDPHTGLVSGTPTAADVGTHQVELTAADGFGGTARQTFQLQIWTAIPNRPPIFKTVPGVHAEPDAAYVYDADAHDPDSDVLRYTLDAAPPGMTVDETTGLVGWPQAAAGTHAVSLRVTDGRGGEAQQIFVLSVGTGTPNAVPQFNSSPPVRGLANELYLYPAAVSDPDGGPAQYSLTQAPTGMTVDANTGLVQWQPTVDQTGLQPVTLRVEDQHGGAAVQRWVIDVTSTSRPAAHVQPAFDATNGFQWQPTVATGLEDHAAHGGAAVQRWTPFPCRRHVTSLNRPPVTFRRRDRGCCRRAALPPSPDQDEFPKCHSATLPLLAQDPEAAPLRYELVSAPAGMTISPLPPAESRGEGVLLTWTPTAADLGWHRVAVRAYDPLDAFAQQVLYLEVRRPNTPPRFTSQPRTSGVAGAVHRDRIAAADDEDAFTFSVVSGPPGLSVDAASGLLFWPSAVTDAGSHAITVRATDDRGLWSDQSFTLELRADDQPPDVSIWLSDDLIQLATTPTVVVQVLAVDDVAVTDVTLSLNGTLLPPDAWRRYEFSPPGPGLYTFTATAADAARNVGTSTRMLRVLDPADTEPPVVVLSSPAGGDVLTYLTDVTGTVTDENLEFYRLQYALAGTDQWTTFHESLPSVTGRSAGVVDGLLGVFDPTLLQRDNYDLRVVAQDLNGQTTIVQLGEPVSVEAQAVLGNFRLDFTDLTIPLAGIPIQIHRTYDTLNSQRSGDFGFGWQLSVSQPNLRESVRVTDAERSGLAAMFASNPFRDGTRVYLTTPAGRRVGFTFAPEPEAGVLGTIWHPRFQPDPGVYDQLTVEDTPLSQRDDGTYTHYLVNLPYNPSEYQLTTKDGLTYRYDQFTGLVDIADRNQNVLTYTADGITSSTGVALQFHRDDQGRITEITDPAGNAIRYTYDAAGDLATVTNQTGDVTTYYYRADPPHYFDYYICPSCVPMVRTEYDQAGRVVGTYDVLGNPVTQTYDLADNTEIVADRLGNETTLTFDVRGNIVSETNALGHTVAYQYDARDNLVAVVNARGYETRFRYDPRGNVTGSTDALGNEYSATYNPFDQIATATDPLGHTAVYRYDANGNLIEVVNAAGNRSFLGRDAQGRIASVTDNRGNTTTFAYGASSLPNAATNPDGSTRQFQYNTFGLVTRYVNETGEATAFQYDASGRVVSAADPAGAVTQFEYDASQLVSVTDALGRVQRFEHDAANRPIRTIDPAGSVTQFAYDANDRRTAVTDPLGRTSRIQYDAAGRIVSRTDGIQPAAEPPAMAPGMAPPLAGAAAADPLARTTVYDYDPAGNVTAVTDALGRVTRYEYDPLDRLVRVVDPADGETRFAYDPLGNLLTTTDPLGRTTRYAYDSLSRLVRVTDPLSGQWSYVYDADGNLVSQTDANGDSTTFAFDDRNRLTAWTDAEGGATAYAHDDAGRVIAWTDALGQTTTVTRDEAGRLRTRTDPLGGVASWTYDLAGNVLSATDEIGRTTATPTTT